jgi:hypothetical protein
MSKTISAEGKTYVVPDDATDDEINQIVGPSKSLGDQPASVGGVASGMANQAGRALGAAWDTAKGVPGALLRIANPVTAAEDMTNAFRSNVDATGRARDAFSKGNYGEAAKSAVGAIPLVGPQMEGIARNATEGKLPEAIGQAGALALLPKAVPKVIEMAPRVGPAIMERMPASIAPLSSIGAGIKAATPGVAGGAGLAAAGAVGSEMLPGGPGKYVFGAAPALAGGRMMVKGIQEGAKAFSNPPTGIEDIPNAPQGQTLKPLPLPRANLSAAPQAKPVPPPRPGPPIQTAQELAPTPTMPAPPLGRGIQVAKPEVPITDPMLDDIAKSLGGSRFSKLSPERQSAARALAEKISPVAIDTRAPVEPPPTLNARIRPQEGIAPATPSPIGQGITPEQVNYLERQVTHADHPFAPNRPFSPSRAARQQGLPGSAPSLEPLDVAAQRARALERLKASFPWDTPAQLAERMRQ